MCSGVDHAPVGEEDPRAHAGVVRELEAGVRAGHDDRLRDSFGPPGVARRGDDGGDVTAGGVSLGLALVQPQTGEVLALQGDSLADGRVAGWDNATQARRQLGSSIKPLLYTLALQQGFRQFDSVLDGPLDGAYQPQNYDGHFSADLTRW